VCVPEHILKDTTRYGNDVAKYDNVVPVDTSVEANRPTFKGPNFCVSKPATRPVYVTMWL